MAESTINVAKELVVTQLQPQPQPIKCFFTMSLIGGILLLIEELGLIYYGFLHNQTGMLVVLFILLIVIIFSFISLLGSYDWWKKVLCINKAVILIMAYVFLISLTAVITIWKAWKDANNLTSAETTQRDEIASTCFIMCLLIVLEFLLFVVFYIPLIFLYPGDALTGVEAQLYGAIANLK